MTTKEEIVAYMKISASEFAEGDSEESQQISHTIVGNDTEIKKKSTSQTYIKTHTYTQEQRYRYTGTNGTTLYYLTFSVPTAKKYSRIKTGKLTQINQPKGVKPIMRERK